jgi:hypothetical protein
MPRRRPGVRTPDQPRVRGGPALPCRDRAGVPGVTTASSPRSTCTVIGADPTPPTCRRRFNLGRVVTVGWARDRAELGSTTVDERSNDQPAGDAGPVTAERMRHLAVEPQGREWVPARRDDGCWKHERSMLPRTKRGRAFSHGRPSRARNHPGLTSQSVQAPGAPHRDVARRPRTTTLGQPGRRLPRMSPVRVRSPAPRRAYGVKENGHLLSWACCLSGRDGYRVATSCPAGVRE